MDDTLPKILLASAKKFGPRTALREKEFGIWHSQSWDVFLARVCNFSLGLISLGLQPGDKIAIIGDNRPEWVIAELAAHAAGAISMGIYQDSIASEV